MSAGATVTCPHGQEVPQACVDCVSETGFGPSEDAEAVRHGVYTLCFDLICSGVSDRDIPDRLIDQLSAPQLRQAALAGLRAYATRALAASRSRRPMLRKKPSDPPPPPPDPGRLAWTGRVTRTSSGSLVDVAVVEHNGRGRSTRQTYLLRKEYLNRQVALGKGRRVAAGDMTKVDLHDKIGQLEKQRSGIGRSVDGFKDHLDVLIETGAETLRSLVEAES